MDNNSNREPIEIFISYSHRDENFKNELDKHLSLLKRQKVISTWNDRKILPGDDWKNNINDHINSADFVLLLVSADFLASDYCYDIEMQRALERHELGEIEVIPVILRPSMWQRAPFGKLQALPKDGLAVSVWSNQDEAFLDVALGIQAAVERISVNNCKKRTNSKTNVSVIKEVDGPIEVGLITNIPENSKRFSFTLYGVRYENHNQADFMTKVYEEVLNRHVDQLDQVVKTQQNVAYAHQIPENHRFYFRPVKEIVIESDKLWIGTSYNKVDKLKQIAKLFKYLGIDPNEALEIDNELLPTVKPSGHSNSSRQKESKNIKFKLYNKEFVAVNQSDFMLIIYEELLKNHPEGLGKVIEQQKNVMYEDKEKAESIDYFRGSRVFNFNGKKVRVGTSFNLNDKLRHIAKLFELRDIPYDVFSSNDIQIAN